ncbi:MAG: tRNA lysidine(34) synthetase TilS, partial [Treponema sp.]|nr:tRNA lysidine(34) synthetase TilS [Treponema sp.]
MNTSLINEFENIITDFLTTFPQGTRFLAAVSGGADSMAMLAALCAAAKSGKNQSGSAEFYFSCIHVEHGIRPAEESLGDAEYVRGFCKENGIKCAVTHIRPGKIEDFARRKGTGIEAAARFFRHRALKKKALTSGENTVTLLAHTKDDLLETAVMRVLRGCGPGGLAAMPPVSG